METQAYLYKWTHIPSQRWYVGSRTAQGCHLNDGYICSSKIVKPMIKENREEWRREILIICSPSYIRNLECDYLTAIDAARDEMSFNGNNGTGKYSFKRGQSNPMKDPEIAKRNHNLTRGERHWTANLNGKPNPQIGQKRPSICGDNHPNKRPDIADKIRKSHTGRKHPYCEGDKNPMRDPAVVAKLSGINHWVNKEENKKSCPHCGITDISKSNYTRWHGENCKHKGKI